MPIVVLHSGGLDSTVCLHLALTREQNVVSVGIDYGQKHSVELDYADQQCQRLGVQRRVLQVAWKKPDRNIPVDRTIDEMRAGSSAFLPGRNAVFLALGCAEAAGLAAKEVWIGINEVDFSGYPDCTGQFLASFNTMLRTAMPNGPSVIAPLLRLSKPDIARHATSFGLGPKDTWSCYRPQYDHGVAQPCGRCDACGLHRLAWSISDLEQRP